ncbi:MAG: patatin-like phospholipase family protein [Ardenticatenales bacterium]|nr:patatin-like phospholipase family protein [Ardenticatenales bacterium]MCB9172078.1 patatin-like phospholipase family protein [Ardenticatenales bacterium]
MDKKKIALVLAGGGVTGIVFEIGVMRAINEAWLNRTANDFDLYVGTSAGSYVAAYLASGVSAQRMHRFIDKETSLFGSGGPVATYFPNVSELVEKTLFWPITALQASGRFLRAREPLVGLSRAAETLLPSGLLDTWLMQQRLYRSYRKHGVGNNFADLKRDLHVIATELDSGDRVVFNRQNPVPLEKAVAASCAIPLLYRPVRINGRDYVDGGLRGTASIDLAVEQGAELIVVVNSLVPHRDESTPDDAETHSQSPRHHIADRGPLAITNQITRASIHAGLIYHIKQIKRAHPHVNVMLIEPPHHDQLLSGRNFMTYHNLREIEDHGFMVGIDFWRRNEAQARDVLKKREIDLATRLPLVA